MNFIFKQLPFFFKECWDAFLENEKKIEIITARPKEKNDEFKRSKPLRVKSNVLNNTDRQKKLEEREINLVTIWGKLENEYFPGDKNLSIYSITWAKRYSKRNLAYCDYQKKRVVVSPVMNNIKLLHMLEPLIYHEMCHAKLGEPKRVRGRYIYHGKDFHKLEALHPFIKEFNDWIHNGGWANAKRVYARKMSSR